MLIRNRGIIKGTPTSTCYYLVFIR